MAYNQIERGVAFDRIALRFIKLCPIHPLFTYSNVIIFIRKFLRDFIRFHRLIMSYLPTHNQHRLIKYLIGVVHLNTSKIGSLYTFTLENGTKSQSIRRQLSTL